MTDRVRQPVGLVHGGVFAAMAESICSAATWLSVKDDGMAAMGQSNSATFLRPITEGHVKRSPARATAAAPPGSGTPRSPTTRGGCAPSSG